jgi:hypothetical protein
MNNLTFGEGSFTKTEAAKVTKAVATPQEKEKELLTAKSALAFLEKTKKDMDNTVASLQAFYTGYSTNELYSVINQLESTCAGLKRTIDKVKEFGL